MSLDIALDNLLSLVWVYDKNTKFHQDDTDIAELIKFTNHWDKAAHQAIADAFRVYGYWYAKLEARIPNTKNVTPKIEKRLENLVAVRRLLRKQQYQIDKNLILEAMRVTDRGERMVRDMIKELMEEKE